MSLETVTQYRLHRDEEDDRFQGESHRRELNSLLRWSPETRIERGRFIRGDETLPDRELRGKRCARSLADGATVSLDQLVCLVAYLDYAQAIYEADLANAGDDHPLMLRESCEAALADIATVRAWLPEEAKS